jgi:DNA integrity scanning protein DisA with diadenylate cyclase activity
VLAYRHATWALLDLQRKYELWVEAVGNDGLATYLFLSALNLADARHGALFVVLRDPAASADQIVSRPDRLDLADASDPSADAAPTRRDLLYLLAGRRVTEIEPTVLGALASIDGALVTDRNGNLISVGAILRHPYTEAHVDEAIVEGARTTAAMTASRFGPVLKVSEDGGITFFDTVKVWDT